MTIDSILQQQSMYYQELLVAQHKVSRIIEHQLSKGELREQFVKDIVCKHYRHLSFHKGILVVDNWQSPQIDFIWLIPDSGIGMLGMFRADECKLFMEIKSEAKKDEIKYFNDYTCTIKKLCPKANIKAGMFCYSTQVSRQIILKDFGFKYDRNIRAYKAYDKAVDLYRSIDFVYVLDLKSSVKHPYFIMRDIFGNNSLFFDDPVIDYFLKLFKGEVSNG